MGYKTVSGESKASFTEKKSEFIGHLIHVQSEDEAVAFIDRIRSENRKAKHNVYAYILREGNTSRYSDDSEPQGTAGVPVLEVLRKEGLTDVCCVVTRYFGGILLGTGGLARAYTQAAKLAVGEARIKDMHRCREISFDCEYGLYGSVVNILPKFGTKTLSSDFTDSVSIRLLCREEETDAFMSELTELSNGKIACVTSELLYGDFSEG